MVERQEGNKCYHKIDLIFTCLFFFFLPFAIFNVGLFSSELWFFLHHVAFTSLIKTPRAILTLVNIETKTLFHTAQLLEKSKTHRNATKFKN